MGAPDGTETAVFVIHTIPGSPFARAVAAVLEEKGAPWRVIGLRPGMLRQPEHLARHPFGRMPVLEHDGFILYETQAILRYLDRVLPAPPLTPAAPRVAARMDQVMGINDWYLFQGGASVIMFQRIVGPRVAGLTPDEAAIATALPQARMVLAELSRLLGDGPWLAGERVSLADLLVAPQIDMLAQTPEWDVMRADVGNLDAWLRRMLERPSMQATGWENIAARAA